MRKIFLLGLILASLSLESQNTDWLTFYEKSGFLETPRYKETIDFCKKLDSISTLVHLEKFGTSPQGRELPLVIIDKNGNSTVDAVNASGNIVLLVQCGIHSGESEGKDAMMMLARDIAVYKKHLDLLDHITILWIPIFNVDGHERFSKYSRINQNGPTEMGWRTTAQNLNLNRDYVKAEAPEMQAWLQLFKQWLPDFFIDSHTTDGADYQYVLTYGIESLGNLDTGLTDWETNRWVPFVSEKMEQSGFPIFPYVSFRNWHDPHSGIAYRPMSPRYSTSYLAAQNRPAVLIETHMLKPYKMRVESTQEMIMLTMELLNIDYKNFKELIRKADDFVLSEQFYEQDFPLEFETDFTDSVAVEFKGVEYTIEKSDLTGGDWFQYSSIPTTFTVEMFTKCTPSKKAKLPLAYIFPPEWSFIQNKLNLHGIDFLVLNKPVSIEVNIYTFDNFKWNQQPYEGRHPITRLELNEKTQTLTFPAGSVLVAAEQRTARLIAHLFEPLGPDSFVSWGYFDAIFEQKEYAESYVMEPMAREMIEQNPSLKEDFEGWKMANPEMAISQWAQLNWFFQQTPFWDTQKDVYPVARIMNNDALQTVLSNL